uniref:Uncharacterized protein n=1 Tax=Equus asinus asinus TaxID=83772 RepID=A0A8C4PNB1_EQUAS
MWYPCVSTTCHMSIMVTRKSFYDTSYYTVFHFTCKILQNSFFLRISYVIFSSLVMENSFFIPPPSSSPLYWY